MIKIKLNKKAVIALVLVVAFILVSVLGVIVYNERMVQSNVQNSQPSSTTKEENVNTDIDKLFNWMNIFKAYADTSNNNYDDILKDDFEAVPVWQPGEINPVIYQKNGKLYRLNDIPIETLVQYCKLLHEKELIPSATKYYFNEYDYQNNSMSRNDSVVKEWGLLYKRIGQPFYIIKNEQFLKEEYEDGRLVKVDVSNGSPFPDIENPVTFMERMTYTFTQNWLKYGNWFTEILPTKPKFNTINVTYSDSPYISKAKNEYVKWANKEVPMPNIESFTANFPTFLPYSSLYDNEVMESFCRSVIRTEIYKFRTNTSTFPFPGYVTKFQNNPILKPEKELSEQYGKISASILSYDITRAQTYLSVRFLKDFDKEFYNKIAAVVKKYKMSLGKDVFISIRMDSAPLTDANEGKSVGQEFNINVRFMYIKPTLDIKPDFRISDSIKKLLQSTRSDEVSTYVVQLEPYTISFEKLYSISEVYSKYDLRPLLAEIGKLYKAIANGKLDVYGYFKFLRNNAKLTSNQPNQYFKNLNNLANDYISLSKSKKPLYVIKFNSSSFRAACLNYKRKYIVDMFYDILNTVGYLDDFKYAWNMGGKYINAVYNTPDPKAKNPDPVNMPNFEWSQDYYPTFITGAVGLLASGYNPSNKELYRVYHDDVNYYLTKKDINLDYFVIKQALANKVIDKKIYDKYFKDIGYCIPILTRPYATKDYKNLVPEALPHLHSIMIVTGRYPDLGTLGKEYPWKSGKTGSIYDTNPIVYRLFPEFVNNDKSSYPYFGVESILVDEITFLDKPSLPWADTSRVKSGLDFTLRAWSTNMAVKSNIEKGKDYEVLSYVGTFIRTAREYEKLLEILKKTAKTQDIIMKNAGYLRSKLGNILEK